MDEIYTIKFDEDLTSFVFYNKILPELHSYFTNFRGKKLYLDLSDVEFINPLAIPNLLTVAIILKKYFGEPAQLFIPWKPHLLSYLSDIKFLEIISNNNLFSFDEKYIGGFETNKINSECSTYAFEYGTSVDEINRSLLKSSSIFRAITKNDIIKDENTLHRVIKFMTEICHNGCTHSGSICFATLQMNMSKKTKYNRAYISVSDCGVGYYESFKNKIIENGYNPYFMNRDEFLNLEKPEDQDIVSILEAVAYRENQSIFGLNDVISRITDIDGVARIHTNKTQLIFTKNNFSKYKFDKKNMLDDFMIKHKEYSKVESNIKYSNVRNSDATFKGVHIEIEVPTNGIIV